ncbi:MAG: alpha/beta hydrolase [Chloroflexota bacterium]
MASQKYILQGSGGHICYWLSGKVDKPLIVFAHGASLDRRLFDPQLVAIGEHYRILTWDMRGHGCSKPIDNNFSLQLAARDLVALIHQAGYQQAVLVGQSMGSYVCQEAIFCHPEIALAFVSLGAPCITLSPSFLANLGLRIGTLLSAFYPYNWLKAPTARAISSTTHGQQYARETLNQMTQSEYAHVMRAVGRGFHTENNDRIQCPLLLAWGQFDYPGMQHNIARWAQRDPASIQLEIPDAGHIANYDNPVFFNKVLLQFLSNHL